MSVVNVSSLTFQRTSIVLLLLGSPLFIVSCSRDREATELLKRVLAAKSAERSSLLKQIHERKEVQVLPSLIGAGLFREMVDAVPLISDMPHSDSMPEVPVSKNSNELYDQLLWSAWHFQEMSPEGFASQADTGGPGPRVKWAMEWLNSGSPIVRHFAAAWLFRRRIGASVGRIMHLITAEPELDFPSVEPLCYEIRKSFAQEAICKGIRAGDSWSLGYVAATQDLQFLPIIVQELERTDHKAPEDLVWALGEMRKRECIPALLQQLEAGRRGTYSYAAKALVKIGDASIAPQLVQLLQSVAPLTRVVIMEALAHLGSDRESLMMERYLDDQSNTPRGRVSEAARYAISEIKKRSGSTSPR